MREASGRRKVAPRPGPGDSENGGRCFRPKRVELLDRSWARQERPLCAVTWNVASGQVGCRSEGAYRFLPEHAQVTLLGSSPAGR